MKKLLLLIIPALWACAKKIEPPIWPDDKTALIMADLSIAEAAVNGISSYSRDSLAKIYYEQIFALHGVTLADYEKNLNLLTYDLPRLGAVMDSAQAILKKKIPTTGAGKLNVPQ